MSSEAEPAVVVGIGASAGGIEALKEMLTAFTLDGAAFVVVMHLPRDRQSMLAQVLDRYTLLDVRLADSGVALERNHIYVVPESQNAAIRGRRLVLDGHGPAGEGLRNIDYFLTSLAFAYGPAAVGVLLSGASSDGAAGLAAIREAGGATFVQSPETALFTAMPRSAASAADFQLDPRALGRRLMRLLEELESEPGGPATPTAR